MKKLIISISFLIIVIGILLCNSSHKTYTDNNKTSFYGKFIIIHEDTGLSGNVTLMYDKDTKIVYFYLGSGRIDGISPYYIIINGEPTIAIYGINYEYQE